MRFTVNSHVRTEGRAYDHPIRMGRVPRAGHRLRHHASAWEVIVTREEALREFDKACAELKNAKCDAKIMIAAAQEKWKVARDAFLKACK